MGHWLADFKAYFNVRGGRVQLIVNFVNMFVRNNWGDSFGMGRWRKGQELYYGDIKVNKKVFNN